MTEPVPVDLALRAVERAIRECDAATPGPWPAAMVDAIDAEGGFMGRTRDDAKFAVLARAGFRGTLKFLRFDLENSGCLSDVSLRAVAPLIAHYDRVSPGWRTE